MRTIALPVNLLSEGSRQKISDFEPWLLRSGKAYQTIRSYLYSARQFLSLYPDVTHDNLLLYKCYLIERYKPRTVNLRIRAINCFMEFLGIPASKLLMVRLQQRPFLENVISQADYEYLKRCLAESEEYTYYFIVRLITATGVRISELITFQIEDVHTGHKDIYSKGNKMRRVYIPRGLVRELQEWLAATHRSTGPLFLNRFHSPISPSGIRAQFKVFAARYGLDPEVVYPHSFRHRFAKNFIEKCGDISLLSDLLGHESIETTRIYLRRSSAEQYRIVNKVVDW